jgi:hypothetical protein
VSQAQDKSLVYSRRKKAAPFIRVSVNLATAHNNAEISFEGAGLLVEKIDGYLTVKFERPSGDALSLRTVPLVVARFSHIYLSNAAQTGKSAILLLLGEGVRVDGFTGVGAVGVYLLPTALGAGASQTVWSPDAGKALKIRRISLTTNTATQLDLLWNTTAWESYFMPGPGVIIANLIGCEEIGPVDALLAVKTSVAATIGARFSGEQI